MVKGTAMLWLLGFNISEKDSKYQAACKMVGIYTAFSLKLRRANARRALTHWAFSCAENAAACMHGRVSDHIIVTGDDASPTGRRGTNKSEDSPNEEP